MKIDILGKKHKKELDLLRFLRSNPQDVFTVQQLTEMNHTEKSIRYLHELGEIKHKNIERRIGHDPIWAYGYKVKKEVWWSRTFVARVGEIGYRDWKVLRKHFELDIYSHKPHSMRNSTFVIWDFPIDIKFQDILWFTRVIDFNSEAKSLGFYNQEIPSGIKEWRTGKLIFYTIGERGLSPV